MSEKPIEKVIDSGSDPAIFLKSIPELLTDFCTENGIDDLAKETQSRWTAALRYIYTHLLKDIDLKRKANYTESGCIMQSTFNAYDYDKVMAVCDYYIYNMCLKYNKEVSNIGFEALTGINDSILNSWLNGNIKLSSKSKEIAQKLNKFREESLSNKLADGKQNPVGVIAILNRRYGWASPYTADSRKQTALPDAELPRLGGVQETKALDVVRNDEHHTI